MLFFEGKDLHLPELDGMALGLKGNITFGHHLVAVSDERPGLFRQVAASRIPARPGR